MKLFLVSFLMGLQLGGSPVEQKFYRDEAMSCPNVEIQAGAIPLNCIQFMDAWTRAKTLYEARVGSTKHIQAAMFHFIKVAPSQFDQFKVPSFGFGPNTYTGMFLAYNNTIMFVTEEAVTWEAFHAIDFHLHPMMKRKGGLQSYNELGQMEEYRWQILGHGTDDDLIYEVQH